MTKTEINGAQDDLARVKEETGLPDTPAMQMVVAIRLGRVLEALQHPVAAPTHAPPKSAPAHRHAPKKAGG